MPNGSGGGVHCPTCTTGLVGYWKFDQTSGTTTPDATGSNTLTVINNSWTTSGKINDAVNYDGVSQQAYVGPITSTNVLYQPNAWSISAWASLASTSLGNYIIATMSNVNPIYLIGYNNSSGTFSIAIGNTTTQWTGYTFPTFSTNTFYHVVATFNGTTITGYINGTSYGTIASTPPSNGTTGYYFTVGANYGGTPYWPGVIDEVGVWSRALTATEVSELYNTNLGLQYPF